MMLLSDLLPLPSSLFFLFLFLFFAIPFLYHTSHQSTTCRSSCIAIFVYTLCPNYFLQSYKPHSITLCQAQKNRILLICTTHSTIPCQVQVDLNSSNRRPPSHHHYVRYGVALFFTFARPESFIRCQIQRGQNLFFIIKRFNSIALRPARRCYILHFARPKVLHTLSDTEGPRHFPRKDSIASCSVRYRGATSLLLLNTVHHQKVTCTTFALPSDVASRAH